MRLPAPSLTLTLIDQDAAARAESNSQSENARAARATALEAPMAAQMKALFSKNATFQSRRRVAMCCSVIAPIFFIGIMVAIQFVLNTLWINKPRNRCPYCGPDPPTDYCVGKSCPEFFFSSDAVKKKECEQHAKTCKGSSCYMNSWATNSQVQWCPNPTGRTQPPMLYVPGVERSDYYHSSTPVLYTGKNKMLASSLSARLFPTHKTLELHNRLYGYKTIFSIVSMTLLSAADLKPTLASKFKDDKVRAALCKLLSPVGSTSACCVNSDTTGKAQLTRSLDVMGISTPQTTTALSKIGNFSSCVAPAVPTAAANGVDLTKIFSTSCVANVGGAVDSILKHFDISGKDLNAALSTWSLYPVVSMSSLLVVLFAPRVPSAANAYGTKYMPSLAPNPVTMLFNMPDVTMGTSTNGRRDFWLEKALSANTKGGSSTDGKGGGEDGWKEWARKGVGDARLISQSCTSMPSHTSCFLKQQSSILRLGQSKVCVNATAAFEPSLAAINQKIYNGYYDTYAEDKSAEIAGLKQFILGLDWRDTSKTKLNINVMYNRTSQLRRGGPPEMERMNAGIKSAVQAFIAETKGSGYAASLAGIREMPKVMTIFRLDLANFIGPFFFVMGFLMLFPGIVVAMVYEKEERLRVMMKMMGLGTSAYWLINYTFFFCIYFVYIGIFLAFGSIDYGASKITIFSANDFGLQFVFYILFINQTISFAFFCSTIISKARTSNIVGNLWVIFGAVMGITLIANFIQSSSTSSSVLILISLVPPFLLYRFFYELAYYAFNASYMGVSGMRWQDLSDDPRNDVDDMMIIMLLEFIVFTVFTLYLDQVMDNGAGVPRHPLFFLENICPQAFLEKFGSTASVSEEPPEDVMAGAGEDVLAEMARVDKMLEKDPSGLHPDSDALLVQRIRKVYPAANGNPPKVANNCVTLGVRRGECLGLLGPNGAGKTTLINTLCGFSVPTSGHALVEGFNIVGEMARIFSLMGVCAQDNHLWDSLTAKEHLLFYGRLKNLTGAKLDEAITKALTQVNLLSNIDDMAGTFSGGMKRRLSVAISLIGSPVVCYLDEPSTGLDPASRRLLWKCISDAKKNGTTMILTTHSMEEAEKLCDRLGIFINGGLHCIDGPKQLAKRYGGTFVLTVSSAVGNEERVTNLVQEMAPSMRLTHRVSGTQMFEVETNEITLSLVFKTMMTKQQEFGITDWAIANTTLEEAFIKIAKGAIGT